jgi:tRNA-dihydrouridine synthase
MDKFPLKEHSLLFAPLEGITDEKYRLAVMKAFPEWDRFSTDFLRVPTVGHFNEKHIIGHFGHRVYKDQSLKEKTTFQILTTEKAQTEPTLKRIEKLGFEHIDLNLGCPSRKVNSHFGGAYLLSDLSALKNVLTKIRKSYPHLFTVKMRLGFRDSQNFINSLKLMEDVGVDAITIHARTRDQLYKGTADWDFIEQAVRAVKVPIIGNGDIWSVEDVKNIFERTGCHSVMLGRGALKTPWLARSFKKGTDENSLFERKKYLTIYFNTLLEEYKKTEIDELKILKRFKSFCRNTFEDFPEGDLIRSKFLRSKTLEEFFNHLQGL